MAASARSSGVLRWIDGNGVDASDSADREQDVWLLANPLGGEVYVSSPRSYRGRTVDLDQGTVAQLEVHQERQRRERWAFDGDYVDSEYVFRKRDGYRLNPRTLSQTFQWIVKASDLPRIRLHHLRLTHASIAVKAGVPIGVVSERLGHASPEFTLHRYSHGNHVPSTTTSRFQVAPCLSVDVHDERQPSRGR